MVMMKIERNEVSMKVAKDVAPYRIKRTTTCALDDGSRIATSNLLDTISPTKRHQKPLPLIISLRTSEASFNTRLPVADDVVQHLASVQLVANGGRKTR
jgi:hypothetical protein